MNSNSVSRLTQTSSQKPAEQQVNRACEACRLLKVRCLPDGTPNSTICQRCKKSGRICIYAAPQKRRQRIRTDTRVAELEREIRAMRSLLTGGDEPIAENIRGEKDDPVTADSREVATPYEADTSATLSLGEEQSSTDGQSRSRQSSIPSSHSTSPDNGISSLNVQSTANGNLGNKDFGLLSCEMSNQLFDSYNNDLVQHYPAVSFPKHTSADHIRKTKPVLFQAVVTAAACQLDSLLFSELFKEMTKIYAEKIFINGEKSLELIQSLMLTSIWYCPPDGSCGPSNLHFYQYIHMAATMALDLGIGLGLDKLEISLEECRCLLACYLNCSGIAMRMRRPNMLQWTSGMSECLAILESAPEISLLDKRLIAWVRLQNIADEWSKSVSIAVPHVELSLKGFERQLQKWKDATDPDVMNVSLILAYHQDSLYLHESALESGSTTLIDFNHKVFRPKSCLRIGSQAEETEVPLTAAYVGAVMSCINSSHTMLDIFFNTDLQTLRVVPIIHFVRASYAIVVLVKLFISASVPSSELGKILDCQVLKVDYYLKHLHIKLEEAAGPLKLRVPMKWLGIARQVTEWYSKHSMSLSHGQRPAVNSLESQDSACSVNGDSCGTNDIRPPDGPNFSSTDSHKKHATRSINPTDSETNNSDNVVNSQQDLSWPSPSNNPPASSGPPNFQHLAAQDPSSLLIAGFTPMDFAQEGFSFLDIPDGNPSGAMDGWAPEDGLIDLADMNYEIGGSDNWGFDFN